MVNGGGIAELLRQAEANANNGAPLGACLDAFGTLSNDDRLKTLLGMHGLIRLILETIRAHQMDIELLDKCCYILSNLTFNNAENMTQVIEHGGIADIVGVLKRHKVVNFLCESAMNVDKNKTLICRSGGAKVTIDCLRQFNKCANDGDEPIVVAAFRCLANLAYVVDNVKQLIKQDAVAMVMDTMQKNTDHRALIQMGIVVLANLSSHEKGLLNINLYIYIYTYIIITINSFIFFFFFKVAHIMVQLGVLDLILAVSKGYPDEIEIQKSCLGCVGNLMNEASNVVAFLDKKGHIRVFEIMKELVFEESVTSLCCKLLKILAANSDIANTLTESGGCRAVAQLLEDNINQSSLVALGCQALCKMISTNEAAKIIANEGIVELMVTISSEKDNWANLEIMNEVIKVVVNFSGLEENAQLYAKGGSVSLLKAIEAHHDNAVFLGNAAMALSKLSVHPTASRPLVKRGAIAVIINSANANIERKGVIARYLRTLSNFLYTETKAGEEITRTNAYQVMQHIVEKHPGFEPLIKEWSEFEKAVRLKSKKIGQAPAKHYSAPIRDRIDKANLRLLTAGTVMRKHGDARKKLIRVDESCELLLFEDTTGKKGPKQLNIRSIQQIRGGNAHPAMRKVAKDCGIEIVSIDPNGREFVVCLETKTGVEGEKWLSALQELVTVCTTAQNKMEGD
ncbi:hypothetical protein RFI_20353 [Reticulomyxa filosa]|uniref:PH domain-containing protein n=1 Tax=Reticulomyxa filosa TaxID=46433 RepID=X6MT34_RETFI|nr:hypothetical protein RFI_20353 [Reticulomyxa filosa]|eukprot:ETO16984.1 hypothetical protein RFI_20353 [Reticulomyxa filosa]